MLSSDILMPLSTPTHCLFFFNILFYFVFLEADLSHSFPQEMHVCVCMCAVEMLTDP